MTFNDTWGYKSIRPQLEVDEDAPPQPDRHRKQRGQLPLERRTDVRGFDSRRERRTAGARRSAPGWRSTARRSMARRPDRSSRGLRVGPDATQKGATRFTCRLRLAQRQRDSGAEIVPARPGVIGGVSAGWQMTKAWSCRGGRPRRICHPRCLARRTVPPSIVTGGVTARPDGCAVRLRPAADGSTTLNAADAEIAGSTCKARVAYGGVLEHRLLVPISQDDRLLGRRPARLATTTSRLRYAADPSARKSAIGSSRSLPASQSDFRNDPPCNRRVGTKFTTVSTRQARPCPPANEGDHRYAEQGHFRPRDEPPLH